MDQFAMTPGTYEVSLLLGMAVNRNRKEGTLTTAQCEYIWKILEMLPNGMLDRLP